MTTFVHPEAREFIRTSGDMVCSKCGKTYYKHPRDPQEEWLHVRCDGVLLKL